MESVNFYYKNETSKSKFSKLTKSEIPTLSVGEELTIIAYNVDDQMFIH